MTTSWVSQVKSHRYVSRTLTALLAAGLFCVGLTGLTTGTAQAGSAGIYSTINYQGRLLTATGAVVPDGTYNMEFQIWQDGNGCVTGCTSANAATNNGGTLKWTEDWVYGTGSPDNRVTVKNGYFSVSLGSITSLSGVNFNWDTNYLTTNIGNTSTAATFSAASGDGYMIPFKRMSANPYAINSAQLGGLTSSQYTQLGQGIQNASTTGTTALIGANQTSTGTILDLQKGGADVLLVNSTGSSLFRPTTDSQIALQVQKAGTSTTVFTVDSSNSRIGIGTAAPAYAVDAVGSVNASVSLKVAGTDVCTTSGCTIAAASGIQNQNSAQQTSSNFWISGTGRADTSVLTPTVDTASSATLSVGTSNANAITLGKINQTTTIPGEILFNGTDVTANSAKIALNGSLNSSATASQYGFSSQITFNPTGGSLNNLYALNNSATLGSSAVSPTIFAGMVSGIATSASYTGLVSSGIGLLLSSPTIAGTQLFNSYKGLFINNNTANGGNTSGTINNFQADLGQITVGAGNGGTVGNDGLRVQGITGGSATGGTTINKGIDLTVPSGTGGTTNNYGLYITGNGAGTTNYSIYNASTAASYFTGTVTSATSVVTPKLSPVSDSTAALVLTNAAGTTNILTVDSTNSAVILGKASTTTGQLTFANASSANTVTLQAGSATTGSYTLTLPASTPGTSQCLQSGSTTATNLTFASCGSYYTPTLVRATGFPASTQTSGATTLSITPAAVGDLVIFTIELNSSSITATGVTSTNATNWQRVASQTDATNTRRTEVWTAQATATSAANVTVTFSGSTTGIGTELLADSITGSLGSNSSWSVDRSATQTNASSTTVAWPSLTANETGEAYWGYADPANTGVAGATSGFGYTVTPTAANLVTLNPSLVAGTAYAPTATQSTAGFSDAAGLIVRLSSIGNESINNSAYSTQVANFNIQSAASNLVTAVLRGNSAGTSDIVDAYDGAGNLINSVGSTGNALVKTSSNSTTAFQVQNASGASMLTVDTAGQQININGNTVLKAAASGGTTPTIVATTTTGRTNATSQTVATSSSTLAGDLVVITGYVEPASEASAGATYGTFSLPGGVSLASGFPINTDDATITTTSTHRLYVWYYYATASGSQNLTISNTANVYMGLTATTVRGGATSGNPFADTPATATSSTSAAGITTTPAVSLTLNGINSLVLWATGDWNGNGGLSFPAGYTNTTDFNGQPNIAGKAYAASGSTGTITAARSGNESGMTAALLSIRSSNILTLQNLAGTSVGNISGTGSVKFQNSTDSSSAFQIQNSSGTAILSADTINGRISIGATGTATSQLYVSGAINSTAVGSVALSDTTGKYAITNGSYTYVAGNSGTPKLAVYDTSDPANLKALGSVTITTNTSDMAVDGSGRYLYTADGNLNIFDVSRPKVPVVAGSYSLGGISAIAVKGNYVYAAGNNKLYSFDVTNPAKPVLVASTTVTNATDIAVSGNYAYVSSGSLSLVVVDIANPATPVQVGQASGGVAGAGSNMFAISVQGHYAYLKNGNDGVAIESFDISNPTSPLNIGYVIGPSNANSNAMQNEVMVPGGRYLYSATQGASLKVYDISTPASMTAVASLGTNVAMAGVRGRYVFLLDLTGTTLKAYDLGGAYAQQLQAGNIETGTLQVDTNANVSGSLNVQGGIGAANINAGNIGTSSLNIGATTAPATSLFGSSDHGGGADSGDNNRLTGSQFTNGASSATVTYLNIYVGATDSYPNNKVQMALYSDSSNVPNTLLATSVSGLLTPYSWNSVAIPSTTLSASTKYWIMFNDNATSGQLDQPYYTTGGACPIAYNSAYAFGTMPATYSAGGTATNCYATFASSVSSNGNSSIFQVQNAGGTVLAAANVQLNTVGIGGIASPSSSLSITRSPNTPTLTNQGTAGSTSYTYEVAPVDLNGMVGPASSTITTATGNATENTTNYNRITWTAVGGGVGSYNVYRTASSGTPGTTGLIGNTSSLTFNDQGITPLNSTVPTSINSLAASTTYRYVVTSTDGAGGESAVNYANEFTFGTSTTGRALLLSWTSVAGARGYNVYRSTTSGAETFLASTSTPGYIDTGAAATGAAAPSTLGTAYQSQLGSGSNSQLAIGNGNGIPVGQLFVGGNFSGSALSNVSVSAGASGRQSIAVNGDYEYVVDEGDGNLWTYNISNPNVGAVQTGNVATRTSCARDVIVAGGYAYVTEDCTNESVEAYSLANPAVPVSVGYAALPAGYDPRTGVVQGKYLYVNETFSGKGYLQIFDISNPAKMVSMGGPLLVSSAVTFSQHGSLAVQGNYAYLVSYNSPNGYMYVLNVSNPAAPVLSSTTLINGTTQGANVIAVRGNYAFLGTQYSSELTIYDISNPAAPAYLSKGGMSTNAGASSIAIVGRYVYLGISDQQGIDAVDISNLTQPILTGRITSATNPVADMVIQGRYAYTLENNALNLGIYDLGGAYTQELQAGSTQTGSLQVDNNANVNGSQSITGGLIVGKGAQFNGDVGVNGAVTLQNAANSAGALQVQNNTGVNALAVNTVTGVVSAGGLATPVISSTSAASGGSLTASSTYYYELTAVDANGYETAASVEASRATTGTNKKITVNWSAITGAVSYKLYRGITTPGSEAGYLAIAGGATVTYVDDGTVGLTGVTTPPTAATAGSLHASASNLTFQSLTNSTTAFMVQNASGTALFTVDTSGSTITIGSGGNTVVFASTGEPTLAGTARHAKTIVLPAEYAGAVLDTTNDSTCAAANNGTMTSAFDLTNRVNYYKWLSAQGTAQCADVVVQVPVPSDWAAWASSTPISIQDYSTNLTNGTMALEVRSSAGTVETSCNYASITPGSASTWIGAGGGCTIAGSYTAGGYMTLRIRMSSLSSAETRIGNITLSYYSKY